MSDRIDIPRENPKWKSLCAPLGYGAERSGGTTRDERCIGFQASENVFGDILQVAGGGGRVGNARDTIKVFCSIYTHPGNNNATNTIRQTWGKRCDGLPTASTETVPESVTVDLPYKENRRDLSIEEFANAFVRSML